MAGCGTFPGLLALEEKTFLIPQTVKDSIRTQKYDSGSGVRRHCGSPPRQTAWTERNSFPVPFKSHFSGHQSQPYMVSVPGLALLEQSSLWVGVAQW